MSNSFQQSYLFYHIYIQLFGECVLILLYTHLVLNCKLKRRAKKSTKSESIVLNLEPKSRFAKYQGISLTFGKANPGLNS